MSDPVDTLAGHRLVAVLYADVTDSTRLYEEQGDAAARAAISTCVEILTGVAARLGGRLVKTIGDEIMCVFREPANALMAGTDMQMAVSDAGEEGRFETGPLRIKVGVHFGTGIEEQDDVFGEAPVIAQAIIKMAKAGQVLTSSETLEAAPPELRVAARFFDRAVAEGHEGELEVFEMIWEVSGLTQAASVLLKKRPKVEHTSLRLSYRGETVVVDAERPNLVLGRVEGNDVVVPTDLTSRQHAEIELRKGRFVITDNSANGTVVVRDDGRTTSLRREHDTLSGRGRICLGGTPDKNPGAVLEYACE